MLDPKLVNPSHQTIFNFILQERPSLKESYHLSFDEFSATIYAAPSIRELVNEDYGLFDNFMISMHRYFGSKPSLHPIRQKRNYYFLVGAMEACKITEAQKEEILFYTKSLLKYNTAWTEQDPYYPGYRYLNRQVWGKFLKPIANSTFIAPDLKFVLSAIATIIYELQYADRADQIQLDLPAIQISGTDHTLTAELLEIADSVLAECPHPA